jgi:sugar phosphate isomerase/epimerase
MLAEEAACFANSASGGVLVERLLDGSRSFRLTRTARDRLRARVAHPPRVPLDERWETILGDLYHERGVIEPVGNPRGRGVRYRLATAGIMRSQRWTRTKEEDGTLKLSLLTYNMARNWELPKIIEFARQGGFSGVEFRAESKHLHGVELETTPEYRRDVRDRMQDAYLEIACIGLSSRFDTPDRQQRKAVVERTKRFVELAAEVGCRRLRVFGNDMPKQGMGGDVPPDRESVLKYVGEALHELGEFGDSHTVDILLEMHGQFNYWHFARTAVEHADHARVGLVYNCDNRDLVGGSVASTYSRVRHLIRHIHMHEFTSGFPYPELFGLLQRDGYEGYCSTELGTEVPPPESFLLLYAQLFRAWVALSAAAGPAALPLQAATSAITATGSRTRN